MRNVVPGKKIIHFTTKKNLVYVPSTPGLSDRLSGMNVEEDECVCSLRCTGHVEEEVEQDECVCTVTCNGVQTHILPRKDNNRDMECDLGIKYCPGIEPILPAYTHVEYKPTTSTGKFTIFKYSSSTTRL